jgi:hypothetical protein
VPDIKLPEITLPTVDIPDTPYFTRPKLQGKLPGCYLYHRDLETTRNPSLLISDKSGTYTLCPNGEIPSYTPMRYDPAQAISTEPVPVNTAPTATQDTNAVQPKSKKDKKVTYEPCPPDKALRIGSFVNEERREKIKDYIRNEDNECITLYEDVPFIDQYIPSPSVVVSTALIASVAATTPLILNAVKPLVKQLIKKLSKKKNKST